MKKLIEDDIDLIANALANALEHMDDEEFIAYISTKARGVDQSMVKIILDEYLALNPKKRGDPIFNEGAFLRDLAVKHHWGLDN